MSDPERRKRGLEAFSKVMGFAPPALAGDLFLDVTLDHLFADVWSRPGLSVRDRRLVTLTVLMGLGNEATLKLHLGAAMRTGQLSDEEIDELVLHVAHYAGWPVAAVASQVVRQLRSERDAAAKSFSTWHGAAQAGNLLMIFGLAVYVWRVANPSDALRFLNPMHIRS